MKRYACVELTDNVCTAWAESYLPLLTTVDAMQIGGAFLGLTATAWGVQMIARTILNR